MSCCQVGSGTLDPTCSFIGDERRRTIFERLFVLSDTRGGDSSDGHVHVNVEKTQKMATEIGVNAEMDIPPAPSSSLPTDSKKRIDDIRNGLQRLGVSLPEDESKHNRTQKKCPAKIRSNHSTSY